MGNAWRKTAGTSDGHQPQATGTIENTLAALASVIAALAALLLAPLLLTHFHLIFKLLSGLFGTWTHAATWIVIGLVLASTYLGLRGWLHVMFIRRSVKRLLK